MIIVHMIKTPIPKITRLSRSGVDRSYHHNRSVITGAKPGELHTTEGVKRCHQSGRDQIEPSKSRIKRGKQYIPRLRKIP